MSNSISKRGYTEVNGLNMYYEIYGQGKPLLLIHGGGSTIQTSFGRIIPLFAKNYQVIAVELQAHGRTGDRNADLSFQQDADDIAELLKNLGISEANVLGFSNGAQTAMEMAIRHPHLVTRLILCSTFYKRSAAVPEFWKSFETAKLSDMPKGLQEGFLAVNNNPDALLNMFNRDVQRMKSFKGWSDEQMQMIKAPTLIINGTHDVGSIEHAVEMYRLIPNSQLAILPGAHGKYLGEIETLEDGRYTQAYAMGLIDEFLEN